MTSDSNREGDSVKSDFIPKGALLSKTSNRQGGSRKVPKSSDLTKPKCVILQDCTFFSNIIPFYGDESNKEFH